ncbi:MAG TPA: 50S ribosomal protein L18 [Chitinophagales bacterium]|nr:50S ribosomal protein L18 [Chitinophagales bacterium]HMU70131.1 50S ribosomal protein L18 [Chitinophagales bacterium]HMX03949.1 50S ribosomal protein L18 [Chitinophagales bacterium]HMZ88231.1 50S ribosomal protein L18 [Chitinophagales bacterium]HNE45546.1 50S ribosomal protein L18 [Chitinophagales bacterium]
MLSKKSIRRQKIRYRIRKKIAGTAECPRLAVFRSNKEIYVQLIDDVAGHTLCAASSNDKQGKAYTGTKVEKAAAVGKQIAAQAQAKGITTVIFDRGGYLYHGRVKSLADGAREGGLQF